MTLISEHVSLVFFEIPSVFSGRSSHIHIKDLVHILVSVTIGNDLELTILVVRSSTNWLSETDLLAVCML